MKKAFMKHGIKFSDKVFTSYGVMKEKNMKKSLGIYY